MSNQQNQSRRVNQTIARNERVRRQRRNGRRHLAALTTQQRAANRANRAAKLAAKLERRRVARELHHKFYGVTTKEMKCAAIRGQHNGVTYTNGTEVPILRTQKVRFRQIAKQEQEQLSAAIRYRRFAAEKGTRFQRSCGYAAGRALNRNWTEVQFREVVPGKAPEVPANITSQQDQHGGAIQKAQKVQLKSCGAAAVGFVPGEGKMFPFVCVSTEDKFRAFEEEAALRVAAAKAKYGAGDLQMSMGETNSSSPTTPQQGEELMMLNNIENIFGNSIAKAVTVANLDSSLEALGYAMGFTMVYVKDGDIVHGCINLPIRNQFGYKAWLKNGAPEINENEKLNFSSLVEPNKENPVISIRCAKQFGGMRQAMFFMSNKWHRPSALISGTPELQPNLRFPNNDHSKVLESSHVVEAEKGDKLPPELLATRQAVRYSVLSNEEYADDYGNVVIPGTGLNLSEGRNVFFFIAEVGHYVTLDMQRTKLFQARVENGEVKDVEGVQRGMFNNAEGRFFGRQLGATRLITTKMSLYNIVDLAGVSAHADWETSQGNNYPRLVFPKEVSFKLAELFLGADNPIIKSGDSYKLNKSIYRQNYNSETYSLFDKLDMTPEYARQFVEDSKEDIAPRSVTPQVDKTVYLKAKTDRPIAEPAVAPSAAPAMTVETEKAEQPNAAPALEMATESQPSVPATVPTPDKVQSLAKEYAAYNYAVSHRWVTHQFPNVNIEDFKSGSDWADKDKLTAMSSLRSSGLAVFIPPIATHYSAMAVTRYLNALCEQDAYADVDFGGRLWGLEHIEAIVEILRSYSIAGQKDLVAKWEEDSKGNPVVVFYGMKFTYVDGIGMMDSRGRLFKNLLQIDYICKDPKKPNKREFLGTSCINSVGNFLRMIYLGLLPMHAANMLEERERIGANLNTLVNTCPDLFPLTSDEIMEDSAMVLWAESNAWAPIGRKDGLTYSPLVYFEAKKQYAFRKCSGAMAKSLSNSYADLTKSVKITGGDMAKEYVSQALNNWSQVSSFNKGCLYSATGFFTDISVLRQTAPTVYANLRDAVTKQCAEHGVAIEEVVKVMKLASVDSLLAFMVVNNNQKATKGTKRILLRAANVIPSGNVVDLEGKPKLRKLLESTHGSKPTFTKWAGLLHKDFFTVKNGTKLNYQHTVGEGTLLKIALPLTAVGPAGEAIFIGNPDQLPTGFNNKINQASLELAECCKEPDTKKFRVGAPKTVVCPIDVEMKDAVLADKEYIKQTIEHRGVDYHYFIPTEPVIVYGDGGSILCGVKTDSETNPLKPVLHEKRNGTGVLEWIRYHIAPTVATSKQLEFEASVTWCENHAKVRSVILKGQLLHAKSSFYINGLNKHIDRNVVDVVCPNDVVKADTMVSMFNTIAATVIYNPDTHDLTFDRMRQLIMDINEEVEGRRHMEYLIEDSTAVAANPKYRELSRTFYDYFKTTSWTNWQQLEHGDFGQAMLRLYTDLVELGDWYELEEKDFAFLAKSGFAKKDGKFLGNLRVFVDNKKITDDTNVFVFAFNEAGQVSSLKQRCLTLVGKNNTPIYDVVCYERSTNKEGVNNNPSGQMDVNVRSVARVTNAAGLNNAGFAEVLMQRQAQNGKQVGMMQAKFLTLMLSKGLSEAMPAAKVLKLGSWVYNEETEETEWSANHKDLSIVKQLLKNVDYESRNHFGQICSLLKDYIIEIDASKEELVNTNTDEEDFYSEPEYQRKSIQIWTPFLYNMNGLQAENNSNNTVSGYFRDILTHAIDGNDSKIKLVTNQMIGMLESFANSESVRKFISGDETVGGKVLAIPSCPTDVYLVVEHSDEWKKLFAAAKRHGHNLSKVPTWTEYQQHGAAVWDTLNREEVFGHTTRSPLADGSISRVVKLPAKGKFFKSYFYSLDNPYKHDYVNGVAVGKAKLDVPYPYFQLVSTVAHTGMNKGDSDGDGTILAILSYHNPTEKQALRAMLTSFEFAWKYCEDSVGGKGQMAAREAYLGDHLLAPKATKKAGVYHQRDWLAITLKKGEFNYAALMQRATFNENNYRALIMQTTFVGVSYRVYRIAEALVDLIKGAPDLIKNNLPAEIKWALQTNSAEVIKAVTELYEIILGATDSLGWDLWNNYYLKSSEGNFKNISKDIPFSAPLQPGQEHKVSDVNNLGKPLATLMKEMKANDKYAPQVICCLWLNSLIANVVKTGATLNISSKVGPRRNFEFLILSAYMSVEAGRAKWSGYNAGNLNESTGSNKVARQKDITRIIGSILNSPAKQGLFKEWATKSHTMNVLMDMVDGNVMGDLVTGKLVINEDGKDYEVNTQKTISDETYNYYMSRLIKRVGDIQAPEVVEVEYVEEDFYGAPVDFDDVIVTDDEDLSYLDDCEEGYNDGFEGPSEEDFGGSAVNDEPPADPDSGPEDEMEEPTMYDEYPPEEDFDEYVDSEPDWDAMAEAEAIFNEELNGAPASPDVDEAPDVPSVEYNNDDYVDEEPDWDAMAEAENILNEEFSNEEPEENPSVAPVMEGASELQAIKEENAKLLSTTGSLKEELAALEAALKAQEEEEKAIAEAKAQRDALRREEAELAAKRDALKAKLNNKYYAQVYGKREVHVVEQEQPKDEPEDKDGGATVTRKPAPKPPAPPTNTVSAKVVNSDLTIATCYGENGLSSSCNEDKEVLTEYRFVDNTYYSTLGSDKDDKGMFYWSTDEGLVGWVREDVNPSEYAKLFGFDNSWDFSEFTVYVGKLVYVNETQPPAPPSSSKPVTDYKEYLTTAKEADLIAHFGESDKFEGYELDGKTCGVLVYEDEHLSWFERPNMLFIHKGHEHTDSVQEAFDGSINNEETLEEIFPIYIGNLTKVYHAEEDSYIEEDYETVWCEVTKQWVRADNIPESTVTKEDLTAALIAHNNVQLDELGWDFDTARTELVKHSNVQTRAELVNWQLVEWIQYCGECLQSKKLNNSSSHGIVDGTQKTVS